MATNASIRIRVGAALDAAALNAFAPLEKSAERARRNIDRSLNAAGTAGAKATKPIASSWEKLEKELDRDANKILRTQERAAKQAERVFEKSEKDKTSALAREARRREGIIRRSSEMAGREASKVAAAEIRAAEKVARADRGGFGGAIGIGRRAGLRVSRGAAMAYGYGGAALSAMAHGLGVSTDVAGMMQQGVNNQDLAQKIVNSSPQFNKASVLARQNEAQGLEGLAQRTGNATGTDTTETLEALEAFVAKTGDLQTAKDTIGDLAVLSRATGTNLADMSNAAAEVALSLGNVPDKGKAVYDVMKAIAGQGKLGAVEIKALASQMAKVATQAGKFEGDRATNIAMLGGMAQVAKAHGGAASASQATTSVQSFVSNLTTGTTLKNWKAKGLSPYTNASQTTLRSPEEIILEAMKSTKGSLPELKKLFTSAQSMRVAGGYADIYRQAGGGDQGIAAIHEAFEEFRRASMTQADVTAAFAAQMTTTKSQVQVFNNEMQQTAEKLQTALLPALEQLAPVVVGLAKDFGALMESDFMKTVLHGGDSGEHTEQDTGNAAIGGINYLSKLKGWERERLRLGTGLGIPSERNKTEETAMLDTQAAPVLAKNAAAIKSAAELVEEDRLEASKVTKSGGKFGSVREMGDHVLSDEEISKKDKAGDVAAHKFMQDKAAMDSLKDVQRDLVTEIQGIRNSLAAGTLTVRIAADSPGAPPPRGGSEPADSPSPH